MGDETGEAPASVSGRVPAGGDGAQAPAARRRLLVQAPVPPLDPHGVIAGVLGTVAFGIFLVVRLLTPAAAGPAPRPDWTRVGVAGVLLGLVFTGYCLYRRR